MAPPAIPVGAAEAAPSCPPGTVCITPAGARLLALWIQRIYAWSREAWARCGPSAAAATPALREVTW